MGIKQAGWRGDQIQVLRRTKATGRPSDRRVTQLPVLITSGCTDAIWIGGALFFFFIQMHNQAPTHVCAKCVNRKPQDSMAHVHITHSLMQTKVTAVSTPSLLFSLGQTTKRSNEKREKKNNNKIFTKEKVRFLFSSLPGNCLKFFFIKEK